MNDKKVGTYCLIQVDEFRLNYNIGCNTSIVYILKKREVEKKEIV